MTGKTLKESDAPLGEPVSEQGMDVEGSDEVEEDLEQGEEGLLGLGQEGEEALGHGNNMTLGTDRESDMRQWTDESLQALSP